MLVLTRKIGEQIVIDGNIRLEVCDVRGDKVRLGITAPPAVKIFREELFNAMSNPPVIDPTGQPNRNKEKSLEGRRKPTF